MSDKKPFTPNIDALFLGPKAENQRFFKEMIDYAVDAHVHWRSDFHPNDEPELTVAQQHEPAFQETLYKTESVLRQLSAKLKDTSVPWFSTRYLGHMNTDTLMVSNLAYVMTMLYNANNVAHEASPSTTGLELDVGADLARMFGYDTRRSWAHLTSGGHVANYEGMWVARNLKTMALAIAEHPKSKDLVEGLSRHQLLSLPVAKLLDMTDELKKRGIFEAVRKLSARGKGVEAEHIGVMLVPVSKHYSWEKAADVLGIGQNHIVPIPVDEHCRTDVKRMREIVRDLIKREIPILAAIAVVGSTEEGAVDPAHEILALRKECEEKYNVSFYLHADAAYGGYTCSAFIDEQSQFIPYDELVARYHRERVFPASVVWPKYEVYEAYKALSQFDSITVDPHKMGYVPYSAGAVCMKDKRIVDLVSYQAAYVFEDEGTETDGSQKVVLGSYIMEGSKAGATAAAVWAAHRVIPLNITGYGRVIARGISTTNWLYQKLLTAPEFRIGNRRFNVRPVLDPDFNMLNFTFMDLDRPELAYHNALNQKMYNLCSYVSGRTYENNFMTSSTTLSRDEYGDAPAYFVKQRGLPASDWETLPSFYMQRASIMTVFLGDEERFNAYWEELLTIWKDKLTRVVEEEMLEAVSQR